MFLLFVHFPLKPFDLKEVDIMVSFPDRYPMQVRAAASIKYTHFYEVYSSCFRCKCFLITFEILFFKSFTLDIPLDQDLPPVMAR